MTREDAVVASALLPPQQYARASARSRCAVCAHKFSPLRLKHHCRQCGEVVCVMCYTARPVNLPVVGLRRVKICAACSAGGVSSSSSSADSSSSASVSSPSSSARNASTRSLAARKLHQLVSTMAPIVVVADASPPLPSRELKARDDALTESGDSLDRASLSAAWEIQDLDVPWVDARLLDDVRVIGSGGNGVVWLVRHRQTRATFAAKRLIGFHCGDDARAKFVDEVRLVSRPSHPRVVAFVGAAWTRQLDLQALFEFMANGDLRRWLTTTMDVPESRGGILAAPWKLQVAIDVADALAYVHAKTPPLVHRDVKSRNVLLDDALRAKLTDFGVSRFESSGGSMTTGVGTGRWLAPEVLNGGGLYGAACDVYSFGVLLSELDTHEAPYSAFVRGDDTPLPEMRLMLLIAAGKLQPSLSDDCPATLRALATACWSFDPPGRPSAVNVAARLRALQSRSFR